MPPTVRMTDVIANVAFKSEEASKIIVAIGLYRRLPYMVPVE